MTTSPEVFADQTFPQIPQRERWRARGGWGPGSSSHHLTGATSGEGYGGKSHRVLPFPASDSSLGVPSPKGSTDDIEKSLLLWRRGRTQVQLHTREKQKRFCSQEGSTGELGTLPAKQLPSNEGPLMKHSLWTVWGPPAAPACRQRGRQGLPTRPAHGQPPPLKTQREPRRGASSIRSCGAERTWKAKDLIHTHTHTKRSSKCQGCCRLSSWELTSTSQSLYCSREKGPLIKKSPSSYPVPIRCTP